MAELDLTFYHGKDGYSDGDETENRLLEIVQSGQSLDDLELNEVSWPILYHLHPVRENICNWYPFRKKSNVLEIGSGCGAITGALCQSGCEVYSVELSQRRARINYERNKGYDNLHIMVGNLNDMQFDTPFDYVLLIGVLEYAGKYTGGEDPYKEFLDNIKKYIKPDGKLLIAIENRLGLKYFAGAKEDHLGKSFAGLNGYDSMEGVRTFSKGELRELLSRAGFPCLRYYYPYPDYKFPLEIFSDEGTKIVSYGRSYYTVDEPRCVLFPENDVTQTLSKEIDIGLFANSFFVEASYAFSEQEKEILYVKPNTDRNKKYRVGTTIRKSGDQLEVLKYALGEEAKEHLKVIRENERLIGQFETVLQSKETADGLVYPYISDLSAEAELKKLIEGKDKEGIFHLFNQIYELCSINTTEMSYRSENFIQWFGVTQTDNVLLCVKPANIDMILDNVFISDKKFTVLDCEWVTDFPVPLAFVMWRMLSSALFHHPDLEKIIDRKELFDRYEISARYEETFSVWSEYFETHYVGNRSLSRFSKGIRIVEFDQGKIDYQQARINQLLGTEEELKDKIQKACKTEAELRQNLFNREKETGELNWQIEYSSARIAQLEETEFNLRKELQDIYNSKSWKLARKTKDIFARVAPPGSKRRRFLYSILRVR